MKKGFVIIYLLLFLLLVYGVAATLYIKSIKNRPAQLSTTLDTSTQPTSSQSAPYEYPGSQLLSVPNPSLTKDWKTYKNTEYGFEIKYPPTWVVSYESYSFPDKSLVTFSENKSKDKKGYLSNAYFDIGKPQQTSQNPESFIKNYFPNKQAVQERINEEIIGYKTFGCGEVCQTYYVLKRGGRIYQLILVKMAYKGNIDLENDQILVNMLDTLKFDSPSHN